jgi:adenosylcobinamide kinase / adenosylcobinamide-phosphate guanylyltransferase
VSLVLLIGGARAGKSALAVELASRWNGEVTFLATAQGRDDEMAERIARHREQRPADWRTVDEPLELRAALESLDDDVFVILDCLTLWVANRLERGDAEEDLLAEAEHVARLAAARAAPLVAVTNEVGLGVVPATPLGRVYRDLLGEVNRTFARSAGTAFLVVAGRALPLVRTEDLRA